MVMSGLQPVMKDDEPPQITRCANTMLSMMQRLGVEQQQFGDSTGTLAELAG